MVMRSILVFMIILYIRTIDAQRRRHSADKSPAPLYDIASKYDIPVITCQLK
jgi:hypothetical protein